MISARIWRVLIIVLSLGAAAAFICWPVYSRLADHRFMSVREIERRERETGDRLVKVFRAVHRYCREKGEVPVSLEELVRSGYLPGLPLNPFTRCPMKAVPLGSEPSPGDYSYVPAYVTGYQDGRVVWHRLRTFDLYGYGIASGKQLGLKRSDLHGARYPARLRSCFADVVFDMGMVGGTSPSFGTRGYAEIPESYEELVRRLGI
jgi:hypothetical protein